MKINQRERGVGPLIGAPNRMSILRNDNVPCHYPCNYPVDFKSPCCVTNCISHVTRIHVACRFLRKARVALSILGVKGHRGGSWLKGGGRGGVGRGWKGGGRASSVH